MITKAYTSFFKELEDSNHKDWFHANKSRYENDVKMPFLTLLEAVISELHLFDPAISVDAKSALFRINRDVRFSKDKTPYNTLMKAGIAPGGKKSALPGYYLGIDAHKIHIGGGMFGVDKDQLRQIRLKIASNHQAFAEIISAQSFKSRLGALQGERAKRLEPDFKALLEDAPFIANKQFYAMGEISLEAYLNDEDLHLTLMEHFKAVFPLNQFLKSAVM